MSAETDLAAQQAAEEHIEACWASLNDEPPEGDEPDFAGPYCGCTTCDVREILSAAYPHLQRGWREDYEREQHTTALIEKDGVAVDVREIAAFRGTTEGWTEVTLKTSGMTVEIHMGTSQFADVLMRVHQALSNG